jgi:hypothetical protein
MAKSTGFTFFHAFDIQQQFGPVNITYLFEVRNISIRFLQFEILS